MPITLNTAAYDTTSGSQSSVDTAKEDMQKMLNKSMVASYQNQSTMSKMGIEQMETKRGLDLLNSAMENAKSIRL